MGWPAVLSEAEAEAEVGRVGQAGPQWDGMLAALLTRHSLLAAPCLHGTSPALVCKPFPAQIISYEMGHGEGEGGSGGGGNAVAAKLAEVQAAIQAGGFWRQVR